MCSSVLPGREDIFIEEATVIRNATEKNVTRIEDMIAALCEFHGNTYVRNACAIYRDLFGPGKGADAFFAVRDGKEVGFALVTWHFSLQQTIKRRLNVHLLYVDPRHWGTLVGLKLMEHLEDFAASFGATELIVSANLQNEPAHQAYLAMGFKRRMIDGAHFKKCSYLRRIKNTYGSSRH